MDLRAISNAAGSGASILAQNDFTIVGDCRGLPALELKEQASTPPLLPLRDRQCLLLIDDAFLEARRDGIDVALSNLYLRVQQYEPDSTSGAIASNGARVWLSGVTMQGERAFGGGSDFGQALNLFNQTYMHVADSTLTGWEEERGALASVNSKSSLVLRDCDITGNGVPTGVLVYTSRILDFTPSTVVVQGGTIEGNAGAFYGLRSAEMGVLYADSPLSVVAASSSRGVEVTAALPLGSIDEDASAPILQPEDSPLLREPDSGQGDAADAGAAQGAVETSPRTVTPPSAQDAQAPPPTGGSRQGGAAYTVFVVVCVAGMVLVGCVLCTLAVWVVRRYKAAQRKEWLHFHDQPETHLQMGTLKPEGDTAALAATYNIPDTAARAGAAYAAQATGGEPQYPPGQPGAASAGVDMPYFDPQSQSMLDAHTAPAWPAGAGVGQGEGAGGAWAAAPASTSAPTETDVQSKATEQQLLR